MKHHFLFLSFVLMASSAVPARANVVPIFNQAGDQATFLFSGMGGDPDAQRLYETLAGAPKEEQGKWTKKAAYVDRNGVQALSVVCVFSKIVPGNGSCTMVLKAAEGMRIGRDKTVDYLVADPAEAAKVAALFVPTASGEFFRVGNRLVLATERDSAGAALRFGISFR